MEWRMAPLWAAPPQAGRPEQGGTASTATPRRRSARTHKRIYTHILSTRARARTTTCTPAFHQALDGGAELSAACVYYDVSFCILQYLKYISCKIFTHQALDGGAELGAAQRRVTAHVHRLRPAVL
jgi:hypothetical protein